MPKLKVFIANDGTTFDPITCRRGGGYWVGPKGRQKKYLSFATAVAALLAMDVPRWRRPNLQGHWGIVNGIEV